ncbi:hypothetical protein EBBID32_13950 [Sphingobium indicum BiD32]|uniref:Uncharacterized protein n=1 Tax=Sphingobium indicum BiD32 TaxID=1301087 RepID=N1MJD0_9SPHN|nr:hypothetical protein [Sphingobium indicum]CCW17056.1 hypothetical protein EBBID32_13950 [Sphingobium indicum BiD32]
MASYALSHARPSSQATVRIEALILRYPDLDERELDELVERIPFMPVIEQALMTADDRFSAKLGAFYRDHGDRLRAPTFRLVLALILPLIAGVGLLSWLLS